MTLPARFYVTLILHRLLAIGSIWIPTNDDLRCLHGFSFVPHHSLIRQRVLEQIIPLVKAVSAHGSPDLNQTLKTSLGVPLTKTIAPVRNPYCQSLKKLTTWYTHHPWGGRCETPSESLHPLGGIQQSCRTDPNSDGTESAHRDI